MFKKIFISAVACATIAQASNFTIEVNNGTNGQSFSKGYSTVSDVLNGLDIDAVKSQIGYAETDALTAKLGFRGLPINLAYVANSNTLTLVIPSIGVSETFTGTDRDKSIDALTDWLKTDGGSTVEKMMKELAKVSPIDPVAGNPNSMMSLSVSNDFSNGFTNVATKQTASTVSNASSSNNIIIAPTYSSLDVDGMKSDSYSLPLAYSFNFDRDSRENVTFSIPVTYVEVEGAKSGSLGLGLAYTKPVTEDWILTPAISYGASGSVDLGAFAQVASVSLTSSYSWDLPSDYTLSMGNMVGYYTTVKFIEHEYAYDPGVQNIVYRNALMLNIPTNGIINDTSLETFVIDTRYTGTDLYMEEYQEYGLSYGYDAFNVNVLSNDEKDAIRRSLKIGFSYLNSSKGNGFKVNFGFAF
nr:hypothetical protein [uncultured Sulfurimonas sp.]